IQNESGRHEDARTELVLAAELHPTDPTILELLARTSFEQGDLERAERSYRVLLLLPRASSEGAERCIGRAEVYAELSELANCRKEPARASDLLASALEAAAESEEEALALERALRRRGRVDWLERAIEARLSRSAHPVAALRALSALVELHDEQ